jgi:hypothetical protein
MPDTMDRLRERMRTLRMRWRTVESACVSVVPDVYSRRPKPFAGIALIDSRRRGDLFNGQARDFALEPGEHSISIYSGPLLRQLRLGAPVASLRFVLRPGEHTQLCFRERPEWKRFDVVWRRERQMVLVLAILFAAVGWLGHPWLREAIATMTLSFGVRQPWLSLCYLPVESRLMTTGVIMDTGAIIGSYAMLASLRRRLREFKERFGDRFFLAQASPDGECSSRSAA